MGDVGKTTISGFTFSNEEVNYVEVDGLAIFQGDIVLGTVQEVEGWNSIKHSDSQLGVAPASVIITGDRYRWIDNIVPYQFDADASADVKGMVLDAISHWEESTAIRFVLRTNANKSDYPDFVNVISDDNACWSYVGMRGGKQDLNVVAGCGFGATVHEFGHAIGLWHEQSREDRDEFVEINWGNIKEEYKGNFNKQITLGRDVGEYDYNSIMHYGRKAFSSNGLDTIVPLKSANIGQRGGLSALDIASIYRFYPEFMPVADIAKRNYSIFLGNSVFLDGRNSFDPNGRSIDYFWSFGDGASVSNTSTTNYRYQKRGRYNIALTVSDDEGNKHTDTATAVVYGVEIIIPIISTLLL